MSKFPQRTKYTTWHNEEPITDVNEALYFLNQQGSSSEHIHLARRRGADGLEWELVEPWYREGSSGGDTGGEHYYQIDTVLAEKLVRDALVRPHKRVGWGYTREEPDTLVISAKGEQAVRTFEEGMRSKALEFLVPGVHTDLTGEPVRCGNGRDQWRHGRVYFDFRTPAGETCRVYPEQDECIVPYPQKSNGEK